MNSENDNTILRITASLIDPRSRTKVGELEIISKEKEECYRKGGCPEGIEAKLIYKKEGKQPETYKGIISSLTDPSKPIVFSIEIDSVTQFIKYSAIMNLWNEKNKVLRGRMYKIPESILLSKAIYDDAPKKEIQKLIRQRDKHQLLIKGAIDFENTHVRISQDVNTKIYQKKAIDTLETVFVPLRNMDKMIGNINASKFNR